MRGISEERLRKLHLNKDLQDISAMQLLSYLVSSQCKELNPWQPIDENTPKDRKILLFYPDNPCSEEMAIIAILNSDDFRKPTYWCELPENPK